MKIQIMVDNEELCVINGEMDTQKALEIWETMSNEKFTEVFALNIINSLRQESSTSEQAKELYGVIQYIISTKWEEFLTENPWNDTQEWFDKFFLEVITSDIQFIPLLDE